MADRKKDAAAPGHRAVDKLSFGAKRPRVEGGEDEGDEKKIMGEGKREGKGSVKKEGAKESV